MIEHLLKRIDPESVAKVNVKGEYWPVYLRTSSANNSQVCLGAVLKFTNPESKLRWQLELPALEANSATREQWQFMLDVINETLTAGDEANPFPANIIYGQRMPFQGQSEDVALKIIVRSQVISNSALPCIASGI